MEVHFKVIGVILILLALSHIIFPKYFDWDKDLQSLSLVNKQMMIVHTFFIAIGVFLMGLLCLVHTNEMIESNLGKSISLGFGVFWTLRLFIQFFGYSSKLWKGKTFETIIHIIFSGLWLYLSVIFWWNYLK